MFSITEQRDASYEVTLWYQNPRVVDECGVEQRWFYADDGITLKKDLITDMLEQNPPIIKGDTEALLAIYIWLS